MDDGKELVPVLSVSVSATSLSAPSHSRLKKSKTEWKEYGFSHQQSCEFGSIQFFQGSQKYKQNSKFLIVDPGEDAAPVLKTILMKWQLALPKLLIHVVGHRKQSGVGYKKSLGRTVARGLIQTISSTDVWLLTNGLHYGITKSVGNLLTDSATEIAIATQHQLVAIGMGPSSSISQFDALQESIGGPVEYQLQSTIRGTNTRLLNPSHTHFIIVNDRGQQSEGSVMSLQHSLIQRISECKIQQSNATVPVVYIVFGGDEENLRSVYDAVVVNSIPVIVVAESGGIADRLAKANAVNQSASSSVNLDDQTKIDKIMSPSYAHLVTIYNEDQEMNEALLQALMKANRQSRGQKELLLAIIWNRMDLVRKELSMNKNWMDLFQEEQLTEALQYALIHNRHEFVGLFLETDCLDLQKFLTRDCLVDLYHQTEPFTLLHKLLNDEKIEREKRLEDKPDLKDVGSILKELMGLSSFVPSGYKAHSTQDAFTSPCRELFIWAVLQHRKEMAFLFWKACGTPLGGALMASKLLKSMSALAKVPEVALDMFQHGRDFQDRAINVMNHCYSENQYNTTLLLKRVLPEWGNLTCLELAGVSRNKQFISQAPVQNLLSRLWMGRMSINTDPIVLWICTLFPFAAAWFLKFTAKDSLTKSSSKGKLNESRTSINTATDHLNSRYVGDEVDGQFRSIQKSFLYRVTPPDASGVSPLQWQQKLMLFIEAPVSRFRYHLIFHLLFLGLFSYVLLKDFHPDPSVLEVILMIWVITLFLEEFRELIQEEGDTMKSRFMSWLLGYWNLIDLVALMMFSIGMVLRSSQDNLDSARIILALDLIVFYLRILQFFSSNRYLGPKLIMIGKMMMDIVTFISILFVFLVAYGIAFQSILYPDEQDSLTIVRGVLYQPYFQMYGELFLTDLHKEECERMQTENMTAASPVSIVCPENSWLGTLVLAFYLFISNIMLLNILIAMLNYTFATVQDNTDTYWKYQRFELVITYHKRPPLAPPFIIFVHIYLVIKATWDCFYRKGRQNASSAMRKYINSTDEKLYSDLSLWESIKGKDFLAAKEREQNQDVLYRLEQTDERLKKISSDTDYLTKDLTQRLESLETSVDQKLTTIASQMTRLEQILHSLQGQQPQVQSPRHYLQDG